MSLWLTPLLVLLLPVPLVAGAGLLAFHVWGMRSRFMQGYYISRLWHTCFLFSSSQRFINFVNQETLEKSQSHPSKLYPGFSPEHRLSELPSSDKAFAF